MDLSSSVLRFGVFLALLFLLLFLEFLWPSRVSRFGIWRRCGNLGLGLVGSFLLWLFAPLAVLSVAAFADAYDLGLLRVLGLSPWIAGVLGFVLLDLVVYLQHLLLHRVSWLWRVHRVHHTDPELDVTSGVRFHPLEVLLSLLLKSGTVLLLGVGFWTVLVFEVMLSGASLFTHCNLSLPARVDRVLRYFVVTPGMHLLHHSVRRAEHDRNYGTVLSLWDRLFGTYLAAARGEFRIGLRRPLPRYVIGLHWLLVQPWLRRARSAEGEQEA